MEDLTIHPHKHLETMAPTIQMYQQVLDRVVVLVKILQVLLVMVVLPH
jgi:hypothetical protein